jgi:hypothetical protein
MKEQKISIPKEVLQQDTGGIKFLLNCPNIRQRYCDKHHLMKMRIFFFQFVFSLWADKTYDEMIQCGFFL